MAFEILHRTFVLLGRGAAAESAEITAALIFGFFLRERSR